MVCRIISTKLTMLFGIVFTTLILSVLVLEIFGTYSCKHRCFDNDANFFDNNGSDLNPSVPQDTRKILTIQKFPFFH